MTKYLEPAKEIDVFGQYDVVIVGGGPAGLAAAIVSGRNQARTLLIEQFGYLGGTATASLMININGFRNQVEPDSTQTVKGIAQEIIRHCTGWMAWARARTRRRPMTSNRARCPTPIAWTQRSSSM